jgi:hypothetical protein
MYYSFSGWIRPEECIRSAVTIEGNGITIKLKPVSTEGINETNVAAEFVNPDYSVEAAEETLREIIDSLLLVLSVESNQPCTFIVATTTVSRREGEREMTAPSGQTSRMVTRSFSADAHIVKGIEDESWLTALRYRDIVRNNPATQYVLRLYRKALEDRENEAVHLYKAIEAIEKNLVGENAMRRTLELSKNYHKKLKQSLNVHRHAELPGKEETSPLDRKECFARCKQIIQKYVAYCQRVVLPLE